MLLIGESHQQKNKKNDWLTFVQGVLVFSLDKKVSLISKKLDLMMINDKNADENAKTSKKNDKWPNAYIFYVAQISQLLIIVMLVKKNVLSFIFVILLAHFWKYNFSYLFKS